MKNVCFPADYAFIESYIPPRCRKPREREVKGVCSVSVPSVISDEAPVAMRHEDCWWRPKVIEYRWYRKKLYKRVLFSDYLCNAEGWWPLEELKKHFHKSYIPYYQYGQDEADAIAKCKEHAKEFLIVDGNQIWKRVGEPRYVIATFGLGHNHASTALMIDNEYNSNISADRYFNALEREKAIERCVEVALNRGDTDSVDDIRDSWPIEVLIPEAVRCKPAKEAGPGDEFLNLLSKLTVGAGSQMEAAVLVIAATGAQIKQAEEQKGSL